jgi:sulfoxide reductase heme-binding subunit YedZ
MPSTDPTTVIALETPKFVWYLMRGSGVVAFVLLSVTMALGVVGVRRWQSSRWPRLVTSSLHRTIPLLALCFLALHVLTALIDSWVGLTWLGVVVPFRSHYRPLWIGLGVLAGDLVLALTATSLLRRHLGYRAWRMVHWGAWLLWPLALVHMLGSGTDATAPWSLAVLAGCLALVAGAALWRLSAPAGTRSRTPVTPTRNEPPALRRLATSGDPR